jgi:hypothetical protein
LDAWHQGPGGVISGWGDSSSAPAISELRSCTGKSVWVAGATAHMISTTTASPARRRRRAQARVGNNDRRLEAAKG